ncbi:unnamed protein product [Heterobilharzia americana]|nr:unnamed protein product [Heterobilharzia americana]
MLPMVFMFVLCLLAGYTTLVSVSSQEIACSHADVRHPSILTKLSHCTVIEGDLFIVFGRIPSDSHLPMLKEITGSLLIYDVEGLDDLSKFLPNLTVIRGQTLVYGYAIVIKSTSLKKIGLRSLRLVQRGGIRVDSNPQLCYVNTVDWNLIFASQSGDVPSYVKIVKNGLLCPDTCLPSCSTGVQIDVKHTSTRSSNLLPKNGSATGFRCWSMAECQSICPESCTVRNLTCTMKRPYKCCHPECLGGCYGDGPDRCVACKNVLHENQCLSRCPNGTFKYLNRRCVTEYQCLVVLPNLIHADSPYLSDSYVNDPFFYNEQVGTNSSFAIFDDSCLLKCPQGYRKSLETGRCYACEDQCELKHCREFLIHSLKTLNTLIGCHSAKAIYLSIQEGEPETVALLLHRAFASLKVIHHSLRIVRSPVLTHLNFLQNIRYIGQVVKNVSSYSTVFEISGNDNLRALWPLAKNSSSSFESGDSLQILSHGLIRITQNRQLCPEKVFNLFESGIIKLPGNNNALTQAERDMITITNGDLAYCNWSEFDVKLSNLSSHSVRVTWPHPSTFQFVSKSSCDDISSIQSDNAKFNPVDEVVLTYLFCQLAPKDLPNIKVRRMYDKKSWRMLTVSCDSNIGGGSISKPPNSESICSTTLNELEPASRYAVYVELKFPLRQTGAISNLVYFTTLSINPSAPRYLWLEPVDNFSLRLTWIPPSKPSGTIDSYLIWIHFLEDKPSEYSERDFCVHKPNWMQSGWRDSVSLKDSGQVAFTNDFCETCLSCPNLYEIEQLSNLRMVSSLHGKHWPSSVSRWMTDESGMVLPAKVVTETSSLKYLASGTVGLLVKKNNLPSKHVSYMHQNLQETCIQANNENTQLLTGFAPFTKVLVEIQACLAFSSISQIQVSKTNCSISPPWVDLKAEAHLNLTQLQDLWSACEYTLCSARSTVINRVNPQVEVDNIPVSTIRTSSYGPGNIRITWSQPIKPNGVIIHYLLQYRQRKQDSVHQYNHSTSNISFPWFTKCISLQNWATVHSKYTSSLNSSLSPDVNRRLRSRTKRRHELNDIIEGGILINDLSPGSYEFQIMAISLAGNGDWSPVKVFTVPVYSDLHGDVFNLIMYKIRRYYLKATAWTSSNPDYCTIYEVDDWEINRDDIDVLQWKYAIGRGSFGTVYKGIVRQLKTPAKVFYNNPVNIPVAIKTISANSTLFDHRDFVNEACFMKQFQSHHLVRLLGLVTKIKPKHKSSKCTIRCLRLCNQLHLGRLCRFFNRVLLRSSFASKSPKSKLYPLLSSSTSNKNMFDSEDFSCNTLGSSDKLSSIVNTSIFNNAKPVGVDKVSPESPLVIMQLMAKGDLASYLRHLGDKGQGSVNPSQAYLWATQIADGMAYLSAKKYVHRDLAARNCLVDSHLTVKIGDFGLCRDVYECNYYHKMSHGRLPIRWMAPESLQTAYFTTQSDVWSYGVVLWEIVTMASLPYRGMSHEEVVRYILDGNTLLSNGLPTNCPELFRALMLHCWKFDPLKRPTFLELCTLLSPRFGDAKFRLASFFYHGEQCVFTNNCLPKALEAPVISLGKLSLSPDQDPAQNLATFLTTFLASPDDELSFDENIEDSCPVDGCSSSLVQFGASSLAVSDKHNHIVCDDPDGETHCVLRSCFENKPSKQDVIKITVSEVENTLRLERLDTATSHSMDSDILPSKPDQIYC